MRRALLIGAILVCRVVAMLAGESAPDEPVAADDGVLLAVLGTMREHPRLGRTSEHTGP